MSKILITIGLTLLYIYLLTLLFEHCVNKASSTLLTTLGLLGFILISFAYATLVLKFIKKDSR